MMVMDEWCDKWCQTNAGSFYADFDQVWQKDLTSFIERDRNHPSIVMWSLGNEVVAAAKIPAYIPNTLKMLVPFAKKLDSTRPYTHACVSGWSDAPGLAALAEVEDIVGRQLPGFPVTATFIQRIRMPCWSAPNKTRMRFPAATSRPGMSVRNAPYVMGHHLWTGVDYLGESKQSLGGEQRLPG